MLMKRSRRYTPAIDCPLFPFGKTVCRTPLASRLTLTHTDPDLGRPTHSGQPGPGRIGDLRRIARAGPGGPGGQPRTEDGLLPQVVGASPAPPRGGRRRIHDHLTGARLSAAPQAAGLTGTRADAPPARHHLCPQAYPERCPNDSAHVWQSQVLRHQHGDLIAPDPGQPGRKLSRTFRSGLSAFVSTSTTLCQVPSAGRPLSTGSVSEGDMNAGST
jgi:hypothetical protein